MVKFRKKIQRPFDSLEHRNIALGISKLFEQRNITLKTSLFTFIILIIQKTFKSMYIYRDYAIKMQTPMDISRFVICYSVYIIQFHKLLDTIK